MKVGIMQPYFFPYLGYWQLMNAVDKYVVYDDVNYIKGGWINRNSILMNGKAHLVNLPLRGASPNKLINEVMVDSNEAVRKKLLRSIEHAYQKAPYFQEVFPMIKQIVLHKQEDLGQFLLFSFRLVKEYLGMRTELILSSDLKKDTTLKGYHKVIAICQELGATTYYNAIGGVELYEPHRQEFEEAGIELRFLKMSAVEYPQFGGEFVPNLSFIDVLMFNSKEQVNELLQQYTLQ
ncbi:MAG: WbqC family protein [Oscillospiraceae bacterium]|nr:WbqC family protein [Oscillospiraceae bacterium]